MAEGFDWEGGETPVALVEELPPDEVPAWAERTASRPSGFPSRGAVGLALVVMCSASFAHGWSAGSKAGGDASRSPVTQVHFVPHNKEVGRCVGLLTTGSHCWLRR